MTTEQEHLGVVSVGPAPSDHLMGYKEAIDAAKMARTRLMTYANGVQRGEIQGGGREFERRIWGAFSDFDQACDAVASPSPAPNTHTTTKTEQEHIGVVAVSPAPLKPCPFCGSDFLMGQEPHDNHPVAGEFYLYHDYGPLGSAARKCRLNIGGHFETETEALNFWNPRT